MDEYEKVLLKIARDIEQGEFASGDEYDSTEGNTAALAAVKLLRKRNAAEQILKAQVVISDCE